MKKFNCYVDVTHQSQVCDADRLMVTRACIPTDSDAGSSGGVSAYHNSVSLMLYFLVCN